MRIIKVSTARLDGETHYNVTYQYDNDLVARSHWLESEELAREFIATIKELENYCTEEGIDISEIGK